MKVYNIVDEESEQKSEKVKSLPKWNALKHGILKESISEYDDVDITNLYESLKEELNPNSTLEDMCIEMPVNNYVKLYRINKAEKEKMKEILNPSTEYGEMSTIEIEGYIPKVESKDVEVLDVYNRYQTSAENRMYKAMVMLKRLKRE
jgi:hypothetical protein